MIFLKLGGSLITDKTRDNTPRLAIIARLAREVKSALDGHPAKIVLGHGSGSFGHAAAKRFDTRAGVHDQLGWRGFSEVSVAAQRLNRLMADALHLSGVPVFSVCPSASARCEDGKLGYLDIEPIQQALAHDLVPLVMGDVAFDSVRGGTIISTEEVFAYLASHLPVTQVLLAGETDGVYHTWEPKGDDARTHTPARLVVPCITPDNWETMRTGVGGSHGADVTGGMAGKVRDMLALVQAHPALTVRIFSGLADGNIMRALAGEHLGTAVAAASQGLLRP